MDELLYKPIIGQNKIKNTCFSYDIENMEIFTDIERTYYKNGYLFGFKLSSGKMKLYKPERGNLIIYEFGDKMYNKICGCFNDKRVDELLDKFMFVDDNENYNYVKYGFWYYDKFIKRG